MVQKIHVFLNTILTILPNEQEQVLHLGLALLSHPAPFVHHLGQALLSHLATFWPSPNVALADQQIPHFGIMAANLYPAANFVFCRQFYTIFYQLIASSLTTFFSEYR